MTEIKPKDGWHLVRLSLADLGGLQSEMDVQFSEDVGHAKLKEHLMGSCEQLVTHFLKKLLPDEKVITA